MKNIFNIKKGFLTVEVIIAASVITVAVLAVMAVAQKSIALARQSLHSAQASFLLEEGAEAVRIVRDNDWNNISVLSTSTTYYPVFSGGTWTLATIATNVGIFTRSVNISDVERDDSTGDIGTGTVDLGTKLVTVTVSWVEGTSTITKTLPFYILDIFS